MTTALGSRSAVLRITHNATNASSSIDVSLTATTQVPIKPVASTPQTIGAECWVEIKVGQAGQPVNNLLGLSFELNFTNTTYIDVVPSYSNNVIPGDSLGTDLVFFSNVDDANGKVSIGVSRKAGAGGVSGSEVVAKVKFKSLATIPYGTQVTFTLTNVTASDPNGQTISLTPGSTTVPFEWLLVWPGDTYQLAKPSYITITVHNLLGQEITSLVNEEKEASYFSVTWDGRDSNGNPVASGIYFYQIKAGWGDFITTRKMLLLR